MIDTNDIDGLAAEYVLGTLTHGERTEVSAARSSSGALDSAIVGWEKRLSLLIESIPEAIPSADLLPKIEHRISLLGISDVVVMVRRVERWRALALAASLAFVIASSLAVHMAQSPPTSAEHVAVLQKGEAAPAFIVSLNEKSLTLNVRTLTAKPPVNKDYELWIIIGSSAPRSLGVLPTEDSRTVKLAGFDLASIREATLAVSVEPPGGSPTGSPTGPVVFTGKFL